MLRSLLMRLMAKGPYYLRIDRHRLSIRNVSSAETLDCKRVVGGDCTAPGACTCTTTASRRISKCGSSHDLHR